MENTSLKKDNFTLNYSVEQSGPYSLASSLVPPDEGLFDGYDLNMVFMVLIVVMYASTVIVAIGGNIFVCYAVCTVRTLRTVTNFFLASLSGSDILMTVLCVPATILSNIIFQYWVFGPFMCPIVQYVQLTVVLQRAFVMVAVTCDRHFVISRPLRRRMCKKTAKTLVVILWISAAFVALPAAIHAKVTYLQHEPGSLGLCIEQWYYQELRYIYSVTILILQYFLPLIIMVGTYIHTGYIIWMKQTPGEPDKARDKKIALSKKKTLKMLFIVVLLYAIAWLPLHVFTIIGESNPTFFDQKYAHMLWLCFHWLAFSNSAMNPVIYCSINNRFRHKYIMIFFKRKQQRRLSSQRIHSPPPRRHFNVNNPEEQTTISVLRRGRFQSDGSTSVDTTAI